MFVKQCRTTLFFIQKCILGFINLFYTFVFNLLVTVTIDVATQNYHGLVMQRSDNGTPYGRNCILCV